MGVVSSSALFRNKRFVLNEMFQQNASKICYILYIRKPMLFFSVFLFRATLYFYLMNALVYVTLDILFDEISTSIRLRIAFIFGVQTL